MLAGKSLLRLTLPKSVVDHAYSCLRATIGLTFAARRAGIQQATSATSASSSVMKTNVAESVGLTS